METIEFKLHQLIPTEGSWLDKNRVDSFIEQYIQGKEVSPIILAPSTPSSFSLQYKPENSYFIVNGHHRTAGLYLAGKKDEIHKGVLLVNDEDVKDCKQGFARYCDSFLELNQMLRRGKESSEEMSVYSVAYFVHICFGQQ